MTMAVCRAGWRVVYAPDARAWTETPGTVGQLWRQRYRWCYGTLQAMWKHRKAIGQSGAAGKLGRRGLPYLLAFQVLLPLLAPAIDVVTLYALLMSASLSLLYVWLGFLAMSLLSAAYAFRLDGERLRPLWSLPLQQIAYRQLSIWWSFNPWQARSMGYGSTGRPYAVGDNWTPSPYSCSRNRVVGA